jgi:hypothetical protein
MTTPPIQPAVTPKYDRPKVGFNRFSERLNGRLAMLAFLIAVVVEYMTGKGVLHWLGLT